LTLETLGLKMTYRTTLSKINVEIFPMPVYEYFCRNCNSRYEKLRPIRESDTPATCPSCSEQNSVRTLSVFIVHNSTGDARSASMSDYSSAYGGGCACGGACSCASHN
jgi:putative FmdB family regulatory protein